MDSVSASWGLRLPGNRVSFSNVLLAAPFALLRVPQCDYLMHYLQCRLGLLQVGSWFRVAGATGSYASAWQRQLHFVESVP